MLPLNEGKEFVVVVVCWIIFGGVVYPVPKLSILGNYWEKL